MDSLSLPGTETFTNANHTINKPSSQSLPLHLQLAEVQCLQPAEHGNNPRNSVSRKHNNFRNDLLLQLRALLSHHFLKKNTNNILRICDDDMSLN